MLCQAKYNFSYGARPRARAAVAKVYNQGQMTPSGNRMTFNRSSSRASAVHCWGLNPSLMRRLPWGL